MHHFHLTVEHISAEMLKALASGLKLKATTIDLIRNADEAQDRMITGYLKDSEVPESEDLIREYFREVRKEVKAFTGSDVIRVKLEEQYSSFDHLFSDIDFSLLDKDNYLEFHFKIDKLFIDSLSDLQVPNAKSSNPDEMAYEFINVRTHNEYDTITLRDWFMENRGLIRSAHIERLVYDDKPNHDKGWIDEK